MKRLPYPQINDHSGKRWWRSIRERDESPELLEEMAREFPEGVAEPPDGVSRRSFFQVMGASFAMAGLAACRRPDERILPYARQPEDVVLGNARYYATAMPWNGTALGLLVESHEGRPTKIEGNPEHPDSKGATNAWAQAEILNLYDPHRSANPRRVPFDPQEKESKDATWADVFRSLRDNGAKFRDTKGAGLAILTTAHRSPTLKAALDALKAAMPDVTIIRFDPFHRDTVRDGARLTFNKPFEQILNVDEAKVVVALDSDFLMDDGARTLRHAHDFALARRDVKPEDAPRLYVAESTLSVTGSMADHRLRMRSKDVSRLALALCKELGVNTAAQADIDNNPAAAKWVKAVAADLKRHGGKGLIVAGARQPAAVHAAVNLANLALGNVGKTVTFVEPFDEAPEGHRGLMALAQRINQKQIGGLVILGGNPAWNAPFDAFLADALPKLKFRVHLSEWRDETSAACLLGATEPGIVAWHLNRAHFLESWGDLRALDGTYSIVQPLIAPLFEGKTDAEVIWMLLGKERRAYDLVRETFMALPSTGMAHDERAWRQALHDGVLAHSAFPAAEPKANDAAANGPALGEIMVPTPQGAFEVVFVPDQHAWDGRFAGNAWMNEQPDPMTKLTWGNAALISKADADELGVEDGDYLDVAHNDGTSRLVPAIVMPGQADRSLTLPVGLGRDTIAIADHRVGVPTLHLRRAEAFWVATTLSVKKAAGQAVLARTQEHYQMEGRGVVRTATAEQYEKEPAIIKEMTEEIPIDPGTKKTLNMYPERDYSKGHQWAMAIDLHTCIGCGTCTIACQAENNIPVVGWKGVTMTREMHWIRIDRYYEGSVTDPRSLTQPMPCQQCENAPCEQVCPVGATTHSPEGLNDMAYNRCIGTKYCLNNCPFKVRRFNFFNYVKRGVGVSELRKAQYNPDVTVRSRGVMEKCTYCVQRINAAKIDSHRRGTEEIADGAITPACAQACPTQAITFGDLNDPSSRVAKLKKEARAYTLLDEINVRARTLYLARITNPNPELA